MPTSFTTVNNGDPLNPAQVNQFAAPINALETAMDGKLNVSLMTTNGDIIIRSGGVPARLPGGTDGQVLKMVSGLPAWATDNTGGGGGNLTDLGDVTLTAPSTGQVLRKSAGDWVNSAIQAGDLPSGIDATKIGAGSVSDTEFGYLDGVTSALQTQLNGKAATSHTHSGSDINTGTVAVARLGSGTPSSSNWLRGDGAWSALAAGDIPSGVDATKIGAGSVSNTEFGYLDGVTSGIQGQIDGKLNVSLMTTNGDIIIRSGGVPARLPGGTDGQVLKMVSGLPAWSTDNTGGGSPQLAIFRRETTDQTGISGSYVTDYLQYNTEAQDTGNHWTVSGDDYTCATTGTYLILQFYYVTDWPTLFSLTKNGSVVNSAGWQQAAGTNRYGNSVWAIELTAGDVLRFSVQSGSTLTLPHGGGWQNYVLILKVG